MNRISWEEYALKLAEVAAFRSCDPFCRAGSCALRYDNTVAGIGYNGAPTGIEIDYSDRDERRKWVVHSEINCLRYIVPGECRLIACTLLPCNDCIKTIASYKIPTIIYRDEYHLDKSSLEVSLKFGIDLIKISS